MWALMPGTCPAPGRQGLGAQCCWLLLPSTVRLGCRASGEQEGCLGRTKEVSYYSLDTHSVRNLLSTVDTLDQAKGMSQETEHQARRRLLQTSTVPLLFCYYSSPLPPSSFSRKIPPQLCHSSESRPRCRKHLVCCTFSRKLTCPHAGNSPWMEDTLGPRAVHLGAAQGAVSWSLMRSLPKR